ncbi:MAG: serine hydrolase [Myxococcota bacterium]
MSKMRLALGLAALFLLGLVVWQRHLPIAGTGWVAKRLCSAVFVAGRTPEAAVEVSVPLPVPIPIPGVIDEETRSVTAYFANAFAPSTARYRDGLGCTLDDPDGAPTPLDTVDFAPSPSRPLPLRVLAPDPALEEAVATAFDPGDAPGYGTRAVVVFHRGALAAEAYAEGFDSRTPLPGWSMTKSVTSAMVGLLVDRGRIDPDAPVPLDVWTDDDPRAAITWDQLLRMSSGLAFDEIYALPSSDALQMLFGIARTNRGRYAATRTLAHPPDTHWSYSSGTSNLLQHALLEVAFDGDLAAYLRFPHERLFGPTGMTSAVLEPDASGTYVGSSHMLATARDWARFGQLYLDDGRVGRRTVLSPGWIEYTRAPTPTNARGIYGAHWWLNADPAEGERRWPSLDADVFAATGFEGQYVIVVPGADLVVVRLGVDRGPRIDIEGLVARIVAVVAPANASVDPGAPDEAAAAASAGATAEALAGDV